MDVAQAYSILGIQDRTGNLTSEGLSLQVQMAIVDQPEREAELMRAEALIRKDAFGEKVEAIDMPSQSDRKKRPLTEWPVGLDNIGNTCYLNSILQFLFTIKPLRELILDFDKHAMPLDPEQIAKKKVGNRSISQQEILRSQKCM